MKQRAICYLFCLSLFACSNNKNIAQTTMPTIDTLVNHINNSQTDSETVNANLQQLRQHSDLVLEFATLNYAWARRGTYYALAGKNGEWKVYQYQSKLPPAEGDVAANVTGVRVSADSVKAILEQYTASKLWETGGSPDGTECAQASGCHINDAETWTLTVATPTNTHTTAYYAPLFFEECCPGNKQRSRFIAIAQLLQSLAGTESSAPEM